MNPLASQDWFSLPLFQAGGKPFTLISLGQLAALLLGVWVMHHVARRWLFDRFLRHARLDDAARFAFGQLFSYAFVAVGVYFSLAAAGLDLTSLAVVVGALGIGLGFGLQNIVGNFFSGLVLLIERPVAIGDRIEVDGIAGRVRRISARSTTVVTNDNITIIVPNTDLITHPVTNWSHGDPKVRLRVPVGVAYGTDPERLRSLLVAMAAAHRAVLRDPHPVVFFDSFGDNAMLFELGVWTADYAHSPRTLRSELNYAIEKTLRANGIEIPFPQRVVHLHPASPPRTTSP